MKNKWKTKKHRVCNCSMSAVLSSHYPCFVYQPGLEKPNSFLESFLVFFGGGVTSFWLTLLWRVPSTSWRCPSKVFLFIWRFFLSFYVMPVTPENICIYPYCIRLNNSSQKELSQIAEQIRIRCSVLFFSHPRSEGWPYHGRILSPFVPVLVILIDSSMESPVHVLTLSIQAVRVSLCSQVYSNTPSHIWRKTTAHMSNQS